MFGHPNGSQTGTQMAPKTAQEAPKTAQEAPKTAQDAFKTAQEAPKTAQEAPKRAPKAPKTAQERLPDIDPGSGMAQGSLEDRSRISILPPRASPAEDKKEV